MQSWLNERVDNLARQGRTRPQPAPRPKRDPYIPNQICTLLQSLEYTLDVLEHGGTPDEIQRCLASGNANLDYVQVCFEPEWDRIHDLLGDQSYPPEEITT